MMRYLTTDDYEILNERLSRVEEDARSLRVKLLQIQKERHCPTCRCD